MKQAYYFLSVAIPTEEDFEELGPGLIPIAEVKLQVRDEYPAGQISLSIFELPLLYGEEEQGQFWC